MEAGRINKEALGRLEEAEAIASRAEQKVPAYRKFLAQQSWPRGMPFEARPHTDKQNYLLAFPYAELLGDDHKSAFTIFRSSGSSGRSFYWPQLKQTHQSSSVALRSFLERAFGVQRKRSLAIVGLALGSWIGGDYFSWALKSMALEAPYPFCVFSPGSRHEEIIEIARKAEGFADQILLFVCPSAIAHIQLRAEEMGDPLPLGKLRFVVIGEPFPESLRIGLQTRAGLAPSEPFMLSVYGSADTGVLGFESLPSVALRRLLSSNSALAERFGLGRIIPHFFHWCAADAYAESVDGELWITRWQGIPLVRYNLHDSVRFLGWRELQAAVRAAESLRPEEEPLRAAVCGAKTDLPDLLAITGRADRSLILCGTNLTESMLDAAVKSSELSHLLTGMYRARIVYEESRQRLEFDLEFRQNAPTDLTALDVVYKQLVQTLGQAQPEFLDDWRNVYCKWDHDPQKRILRLNCLRWPALSESTESQIKQRSVQG